MTFEEIVRLPQHTLKKMVIHELQRTGYQTITQKGFTYAQGELPVLLVAHLDTVHREAVKTICHSPDGKIIMSPQGIGGDDRAGVYMILQIIRKHRCHVLFCEEEETGGIGAHQFVESGIQPEINYIIELDRRGADHAVFYDCDNPEFTDFICGFSYQEEFGSFSDISIIAPRLGVAAVNLSAGYYNEHTLHEFVDMDVVQRNIERMSQIVTTPSSSFEYLEAMEFRRGLPFTYGRFFDDLEAQELKLIAKQFGVPDYEVDALLDYGYCPDEIEMLLNFPQEFRKAINELLYEEA